MDCNRKQYNGSLEVMKSCKTLILITVIMMAVFMPGCSDTAVDEDGLARSYRGKTVILSTNDVHGNLSGYQYVAGLKDELEDRGAEVLLVDCGDYSQGEMYAGEYKGESVIDLIVPDFLAEGGDSYHILTEASESIDTGIALQYAVTEYIRDALDGHIDDSYSEPKDRIHIMSQE